MVDWIEKMVKPVGANTWPCMQLGEVNIGTLVTRLVCGRALTNDSAINSTLQNGNVIEDTPVIISDGQFCVQAAPSSPSQAEIVSSDIVANHFEYDTTYATFSCCVPCLCMGETICRWAWDKQWLVLKEVCQSKNGDKGPLLLLLLLPPSVVQVAE